MVPEVSVESVWSVDCQLGEGVVWDAPSGRVLFVDIHGKQIHAWHPLTRLRESWFSPERVGWVLPTTVAGRYAIGLQSGFATTTLGPCIEPAWLARVFQHHPAWRLNDAKTDAEGRLWGGSLNNDDESQPDGLFFRLNGDGTVKVVDQGYCVCNGPAIHPDGQLLLHTDSARKTIYAFDLREGELSNKRTWKVLPEGEGYPDGMSFDANGHIWIAHWGGACVSQFTQGGDLRQRIALPTSHITNICFGGEHLDRMFVTSAKVGLSSEQLASQPLAGALFEIHGHGAVGFAATPFKL